MRLLFMKARCHTNIEPFFVWFGVLVARAIGGQLGFTVLYRVNRSGRGNESLKLGISARIRSLIHYGRLLAVLFAGEILVPLTDGSHPAG